ncbi:hypothetical protein NQ317_014802 [Molorchus minor]|uniref:Anaphase-promoting complex subunit 1 n=1 Tax=Molorchus minor TaxID=1323400 RepID=A0ABQ9JTZ3_9CUCU|nr:hypothetical protein NQ317_014802 [Molorchus minor]
MESIQRKKETKPRGHKLIDYSKFHAKIVPDYMEDELYVKGHTVIWSQGLVNNTDGLDNGRKTLCCYTSPFPVHQALWCTYYCERPTFDTNLLDMVKSDEPSGTPVEAVCISDSHNIRVYTPKGEDYAISVPFSISKLWNTKYGIFIEKEDDGAASKVFLTDDLVGCWYLCYMLNSRCQLSVVKIDFSNPASINFGILTSISAKDAIPIPHLHMLAILEHNGNITLYSGLTVVGKLHIGGTLAQHTPSPFVRRSMHNNYSPFPRFNTDVRVNEARKMLQSSKPVPIILTQRPDVSDHDFIEEQEKHLYGICIRTMALPVGRGMFTLRTATPVITEPLPAPPLCLTGKVPPRGTTVDLNHIDTPANMSLWPLFHNGVANGLRITPDAHNIDNTWIIFNKTKTGADPQMEHAGFLLALGLNGHLKNLALNSTFNYLEKLHEMTSVGILLGLMYLGTGNKAVADWMAPPETQYLLDFVRPDFLMLRILSRSLILWADIEPCKKWVEGQVPSTIRPYCMVKPCHSLDIDYEAMNQAYCNIVAGACFAMGLKFAGTANQEAFEALLYFCHMFTSLTAKSIAELAGKSTIETCLNVLILSAAMVMAGTGNLGNNATGSALAKKGGQLKQSSRGGRYTLSNSPASVAALICAFYPKFPTHSNDNR